MCKHSPVFKIGEIVVIKRYGTVGAITNYKYLDNVYAYEVGGGEELYVESSLQSLKQYHKEQSEEIERITVTYNYYLGDLVQVRGEGSNLYRIIGIRTELWRYKEESWEENIYELFRITDGKWLEAPEDELTIVADSITIQKYMRKFKRTYLLKKRQSIMKMDPSQALSLKKKEMINRLLDLYNDYKILYHLFGDEKYKVVMKRSFIHLHEIMKSEL